MRWAVGLLAAWLALAGCQSPANPDAPPSLVAGDFSGLPDWAADTTAEAVPALLQSCDHISKTDRAPAATDTGLVAGDAAQWRNLCREARALPPGDAAARQFFETVFRPYEVRAGGTDTALLTGYYEPEIAGSRHPGPGYATPIHARPADARSRAFTRAQIEAGALRKKRLELAWLADPTDAFFLQIQGSGRIRLPDGGVMRVGYAGQNGRPYVPIGRLLVDRGDMELSEVTMQSIRAWLIAHPDRVAGLLRQNPSYVFFRELTGITADQGPVGALGVPLTPGRSLAVDRRFLPLGVPMFIDTTDPVDGARVRRLMVAQDTGGAIRGALRGDVFFGWGQRAEQRAGLMKQPGRLWLLLPRAGGV